MDKNTMDELRRLVDEVMFTPTKKDARATIRRLESMVLGIRGGLDGYFAGKLDEIISYAKAASGQARNKEHWISMTNLSWSVFESGVEK